MLARDIMITNLFALREDHDLNMAQVLSEGKHIRHMPVVNSAGVPVGIIACRDIARVLSKPESSRFVPVREVMNAELVTASPQESVREIIDSMIENEATAVLVLENNTLVGIITERDIVRGLKQYGNKLLV